MSEVLAASQRNNSIVYMRLTNHKWNCNATAVLASTPLGGLSRSLAASIALPLNRTALDCTPIALMTKHSLV